MKLSDFLFSQNAVASRSEFRKLLGTDAISINGVNKLGIEDVEVYPSDVVKVGKKQEFIVPERP